MSRKALVVGVDYYESLIALKGCANDASNVTKVLARNYDMSKNFDVQIKLCRDEKSRISKTELRNNIRELFSGEGDIALFYFAGHGHIDGNHGYICGSDADSGIEGLPLAEIMSMANNSRYLNKIIILDSCHSGVVAGSTNNSALSEVFEGVTILTASTADQYASEENDEGIFTTLFVDALNGAASNLLGEVTPGSVYAHIDQSLGDWTQRPVFKTNVRKFVSLRKVKPPIELSELHKLTTLFPCEGFLYQLDPSYEPERHPSDSATIPPCATNVQTFKTLQQYNKLNLLVPEGAPHMWHAAMYSQAAKLTPLGEHYRQLVRKERI